MFSYELVCLAEWLYDSMVQVTVSYSSENSICDIISKINSSVNPHIIFWYIGTHGLKKSSILFHKQLIAPIYLNNFSATFWLYDLTAWAALKNPNLSISKISRHIPKISNIDINRIKCITSADIFNKMKKVTDQQIIKYLQGALSKNFIWQSSLDAYQSGVTIEDLFKSSCPVLAKYYKYDANRGYSMLQYLEGCLLVDEVINIVQHTSSQKDIQIFFVLPNDEVKYYKDKTDAFKKDIKFLINKLYGSKMAKVKVNINFLPFKYGKFVFQRPYHEPGRVATATDLCSLHLITNESN